jgi:hypothetical protein
MTRLAPPPGIEVPPGSAAPPPSAASTAVSPSAPAAAAAAAASVAAPPVERLPADEAVRFSTTPFTPGGLAYDAVSRRFLFGDRVGRRLFVVGEGSDRAVDLVRGESAGFEQVTAIAIDPKRGDLWVAASSADGGGGAIHHLQLISGRALAKLSVPGGGQARLTDIAVAGDGRVFVLDSAAPRLLTLRPGATALEPLMPLTMQEPVSITVDEEGRTAYVANREGIARVDLQARRAAPLTAAKGITLSGFDFVRLHRDGLVGSQVLPDKSRGLIRLRLNGDRRTVTEAKLIETPAGIQEEATPATVSGGDLYYVVAERTNGQDGAITVRVRRIKLP